MKRLFTLTLIAMVLSVSTLSARIITISNSSSKDNSNNSNTELEINMDVDSFLQSSFGNIFEGEESNESNSRHFGNNSNNNWQNNNNWPNNNNRPNNNRPNNNRPNGHYEPLPDGYERWTSYDVIQVYTEERFRRGVINEDCEEVDAIYAPANLRPGQYNIRITRELGSRLFRTDRGKLCIRTRNMAIMRSNQRGLLIWDGSRGKFYRSPSF